MHHVSGSVDPKAHVMAPYNIVLLEVNTTIFKCRISINQIQFTILENTPKIILIIKKKKKIPT